jgi:predicted peroxiredoxin
MQNHVKFAIAIPVFAAVLMGAISLFPAAQQQAQAQHTDHTAMASTSSSGYSGHSGGATVMIHITSGVPTDSHQVHSTIMGVEHAISLQESGKNVVILLDVDGVRIAAQQPATELAAVNGELKVFLDNGGRVIACDHCVMMAGLEPEDILPGVEFDSHPFMPRMQKVLDEASVVLDY